MPNDPLHRPACGARAPARTCVLFLPSVKTSRRVAAALALLTMAACNDAASPPSAADLSAVHIVGTLWQPDNETLHPQGIWERLGAKTLLVQWTVKDDQAFLEGCGVGAAAAPPPAPAPAATGGAGGNVGPAAPAPKPPPPSPARLMQEPVPGQTLPDWQRIAREPWAHDVILGLAAHGDEAMARRNVVELTRRSRCLAALATPLHVTGWYFPVEVDPTWKGAADLVPLLNSLPRPLWISVYDGANIGADALAIWVKGWLPKDVGVFFQDGAGVHARSAPVARKYLVALQKELGVDRVRLIAEAFRPAPWGGFRPATAEELEPQLAAYGGLDVFLFDGPHYVGPRLVEQLRQKLIPVGPENSGS
jgi:hypothetical protein